MSRRIIKPKGQEKVPEFPVRPVLVGMSAAPFRPTHDKAVSVLSKIPGGFQKFVVSDGPGRFVPVVMLMPTEFTPDIINHVRRNGAHVMVGLATLEDLK